MVIKRKKYYTNEFINQNKRKKWKLDSNSKGILMSVSADSRATTAFKDIVAIFNDISPIEDISINNNKYNVNDNLQSEILQLRSNIERFSLIGNISRCLILIKFDRTEDLPSEIVAKVMNKAYNEYINNNKSSYSNILSSRFISRLIPLDYICMPSSNELKNILKLAIIKNFPYCFISGKGSNIDYLNQNENQEYKISWSCCYSSRHNKVSLKRQVVYDICSELIWGLESNIYDKLKKIYPVNLENPTKTILVEVTGKFCGISIVNEYHKHFKYNLHQIMNIKYLGDN
ncbi:hypothetical protein ACR3K2_39190 [Cryptosporidium serpentis]